MITVFIGGSRRITRLSKAIQSRLDNMIDKSFTVVTGDANGVDKAVQKYFAGRHYKNVVVFLWFHDMGHEKQGNTEQYN
jgi:adenine-specific DNA-methyltransferase